jgi:uncharacterized membrane protein
MECPFCHHQVEPGSDRCHNCGSAVRPPDQFGEIKREILAARQETAAILERLNLISERFDAIVPSAEPEQPAESWEVEPVEDEHSEAGPELEEPAALVTYEKTLNLNTSGKPMDREFAPSAPSVGGHGFSEVKFGQKWLLIVGIVIMVLGIGYFLKYSFEQGWVGPAGRVASSYLSGMICLGAGEFFRRRLSRMFGLYLAGGGIAILYAATFAGYQLYSLLGQIPAFGIMVLVTVLAGTLSIFYDTKWIAVLGIVGGFLTPVIISSGRDQQIALMTYMIILNGGILFVAFFKRWSLLTHLGMGFTWLLFSAWTLQHYSVGKFWVTLVFLNLFFLIYALAPFAYYFIKERTEKLGGFAISFSNSFIAFGYAYALITDYSSRQYASIASVFYAAVFIGLAHYLYRRLGENMDAFILLLAKAMLFLVITVPILFSDQWVTVFWIAQAVAIIWAALRLKNKPLYRGGAVLLLLSSAKYFVWDQPESFMFDVSAFQYGWGYTNHILERWVTTAILMAGMYFVTRMVRGSDRSLDVFPGKDLAIFYGIFAGFLFAIVNMEVSGFFFEFAPQARFASISVLWALFSICFMAIGFYYRQGLVRSVSLGLFAVTILKVFVFDMSNVSTPFRIISFIVLGLMLIGASYLYHRYKSLILPEDDEEDEAKKGAEL